jgi:osmotically inducible protein OsmC
MPARRAEAEWRGDLKQGGGRLKLGSGAFEGAYTFRDRFEDGAGTNPEELLGAAHAGCFSMALSAGLTAAGHPPTRIHTTATVHIDKVGEGFAITKIELVTEGAVPGIDEAAFKSQAETAKAGCPVSKALAAVGTITLSAKLVPA